MPMICLHNQAVCSNEVASNIMTEKNVCDQYIKKYWLANKISSFTHHHMGGSAWMCRSPLIARFMGPTWAPPGSDRTQVGPMLAPWTLLSRSFTWFGYHLIAKPGTKADVPPWPDPYELVAIIVLKSKTKPAYNDSTQWRKGYEIITRCKILNLRLLFLWAQK